MAKKITDTKSWALLNNLSLSQRYDVLSQGKSTFEENWQVKISFLPLTEIAVLAKDDMALSVQDDKSVLMAVFTPKT